MCADYQLKDKNTGIPEPNARKDILNTNLLKLVIRWFTPPVGGHSTKQQRETDGYTRKRKQSDLIKTKIFLG